MFSYCANNPVNREDSSGYLWRFIKEFVSQVANVFNAFKPVYAAAGGLAIADGPLPFGEVLGLATVVVASVAVLAVATINTITYSSKSSSDDTENKEYENAKSRGIPSNDHTVVPKVSNKNPNNSRPNSSSDVLNKDGSVKQRRYYGPDGKPELDIDFNHQGQETHVFPHSHTWDWSVSKPRLNWEPWVPK